MNTSYILTSLTLASVAAFAYGAWRFHRALRTVDLMREELARELTQAKILDHLLQLICVDAFELQHRPIWQAWCEVMGEFKVQIKPIRHYRNEEDKS